MSTNSTFRDRSRLAIQNTNLQRALRNATTRFLKSCAEAVAEIPQWEAMREQASQIKEETLARLDEVLEEFTRNATRAGAKVVRVKNSEEALDYVSSIVHRIGAKLAVKGKSMASEEIGLNDFLAEHGVRALETDLGEYIVQLAREMPSHIIAPAIHKSRRDVQELFQEVLGEGKDAGINELTLIARRRLRSMFLEADLGFSGANFLVADTGSIVLVENEGNIRFSTSLPRVHVAIVGMEKIVPRERDLGIFLPLLIRSATGQKMSSYVSVITGPRQSQDPDGPEELHVLLLDNGRRKILEDPRLRPTLKCIRCAACLNTCPVYQSTGGHAYATVYSGPIGAVLTPQLRGMRRSGDLAFASSLCGACGDICPVKVPLPHLLLELRADAARKSATVVTTPAKKRAFKLWATAMCSPRVYSIASRVARAALKRPLLLRRVAPTFDSWASVRGAIDPPPRSFRELWKEFPEASLASNHRPQIQAAPASKSGGSPVTAFSEESIEEAVRSAADAVSQRRTLVDRFLAELEHAGGAGYRVSNSDELGAALDRIVGEEAPQHVLIARSASDFLAGLADRVKQKGCQPLEAECWDDAFATAANARAGITAAFAAIADSGSLLLRHGAGEPRSFSLLPEHHIALVHASQIVASLPQAIDRVIQSGSFGARACWTFITGPSRTGDIELTLTIGVHGPKRVSVIVVDG